MPLTFRGRSFLCAFSCRRGSACINGFMNIGLIIVHGREKGDAYGEW
jgi:hypothetical protein